MPYAATIGFFDGVHRGHQYLVRLLRHEAARRGMETMVITFLHHPRAVFAPHDVPPLLTTHSEREEALRSMGVDQVHILPFDAEMASLTARTFMHDILLDGLHVGTLLMGYDHHFGRPQQPPEDFGDYHTYGKQLGIEVIQAPEAPLPHISSSQIRHWLLQGDILQATAGLGRPYRWQGTVVHGHAIGRELGFPTANLCATDPQKIVPARGVYAVRANGHPAMLNIGTCPTLRSTTEVSIEVHLLDIQRDLYGTTLDIEFISRLRPECTFPDTDSLRHQLVQDKNRCLQLLTPQP